MIDIKKNRKISLLIAVMVVLGIGMLSVFRYQFSFSTNDDVMFKAILRGDITGKPDGHLIFTMYPLGLLLKSLYVLNNSIPWYDGFVLLLHFLGYFLVILRTGKVLSKKKTGVMVLGEIISGIVLLSLDLPYLILHQWTSFAAFLFAVALFYYFTEGDETKERIKGYFVIGLFLILSFWIRKEVFLMGMPLFGLAMIHRFGRKNKIPRDKYVFGAILLILLLLSFVFDKMAYSSEEWKTFQSYNKARSDVYDFYGLPPYGETTEEYEKRNLKESDLYPFGTWDLAMFEDCYEDNMVSFAQFSKGYWNRLHFQKWALRYTFNLELKYFTGEWNTVLAPASVILSVIGIIVFSVLKKRKAAILLTLAFCYELAFVYYCLFFGRFPERVAYGFFLLHILFAICVFLREIAKAGEEKKSKQSSKTAFTVTLIGLFILLPVLALRIYSTDKTVKKQDEKLKEWEEINSYFANHPQNMYYLQTNDFSTYGEKMFRGETFEQNNYLRLGSWIAGGPLHKKQLENKGTEPWNRILRDETVLFVESEHIDSQWITNFYEGRGISVKVEQVDELVVSDNQKFPVYSIRENIGTDSAEDLTIEK